MIELKQWQRAEIRMLDYILDCVAETGTTPSTYEIAKFFDLRSDNAVRHHLKKLREQGHLTPSHRIELSDKYEITIVLARP